MLNNSTFVLPFKRPLGHLFVNHFILRICLDPLLKDILLGLIIILWIESHIQWSLLIRPSWVILVNIIEKVIGTLAWLGRDSCIKNVRLNYSSIYVCIYCVYICIFSGCYRHDVVTGLYASQRRGYHSYRIWRILRLITSHNSHYTIHHPGAIILYHTSPGAILL